MQPQLNFLTSPPHAADQSDYTLLWDSIPFLNKEPSQVIQCGCVSYPSTHSTTKLIPQVFNGVVRTDSSHHPLNSFILKVVIDDSGSVETSVVRTDSRPLHPLNSFILKVVIDDSGSVVVRTSVVILEYGIRALGAILFKNGTATGSRITSR